MIPDDLRASILHTKHQIDCLKQQLEEATGPKEQRRMQHQLKELQILQLWQLSQEGADPH